MSAPSEIQPTFTTPGVVTYRNISEDEWRELRARDVTSTEVAALFNASPYVTSFELWHRKKDKLVVNFDLGERAEWGQYLEPVIAKRICQLKGWTGREMKEYIRDPEAKIGASFDWLVNDTGNPDAPESEWAILEIKNVDSLIFKDGWIVGDEESDGIEAPPHIEFQVQAQLAVTRRARAYIGVLIGGNRVEVIRRDADENIIKAIRLKVRQFWASIERNEQPAPDFSRDMETIARLYGYAEPNKVLDARETQVGEELMALAVRDGQLLEQEKELKLARSTIKAKTLTLVGDAEKVLLSPGFSVTASLVGPAEIPAHTRDGYRLCRFNRPKSKKGA